MSQHKEDEIQKAKNALDRLTGCDLSHLSLEEAKLIQRIRDLNLNPSILTELVLIKELNNGLTPDQIKRIQDLKPGESITVNDQLFGREKDWKQE